MHSTKIKILTQEEFFNSKQAFARLFAVVLFMFSLANVFLFGLGDASSVAEAEEKIVRVGYFSDNDVFQSGFTDDTHKNGYAYAYIQEVAKHTGWKYQYVYGSWEEMLGKLEKGEIDIMGGISHRQTVAPEVLFPSMPMGREDYHVLVHDDRAVDGMGSPRALTGLRIGVPMNSTIEAVLKDFVKEHGISCEIVPLWNSFSRMEMFRHRRIDAVATVDSNMLEGVKSVIKFGGTHFYLCVSKGRPDLLGDLNRAQEEIFTRQPSFDTSLHERYLSKKYIRQGLNREELEWLHGREIKIACLKNFLPYCGYDDKTGKWSGVVRIARERLEKFTGCKVSLRQFDDRPSMLKALKNGEVDAAFPLYNDLWYAEQEGLFGTGRFAPDRMAVVYKGEYSDEIYKKIGVPRLTESAMKYMKGAYLRSEFKEYDQLTDCLEAIESGEISCAVVSGGVLHRYLDRMGEFSDLHIIDADNIDYSFVTRRENRIFYGILTRCLADVSAGDINDSIIGSTFDTTDYSLSSFIRHNSGKVTMGFLLFILLLVVNFWVYWKRTQKHSAEMAAALEREANYSHQLITANENLRRQMDIIREQEGIITIDALTQVNNRYQLGKYTEELFAGFDPKKGEKIYLAICDMNNFKPINDKYGHEEGDKALVTAANAMKSACAGTNAFLARYGGDEFVIIVQAKDDSLIKGIRDKVNAYLAGAGESLPYELSVSIGIAERYDETESFDRLFRRADAELYRLKEKIHQGTKIR